MVMELSYAPLASHMSRENWLILNRDSQNLNLVLPRRQPWQQRLGPYTRPLFIAVVRWPLAFFICCYLNLSLVKKEFLNGTSLEVASGASYLDREFFLLFLLLLYLHWKENPFLLQQKYSLIMFASLLQEWNQYCSVGWVLELILFKCHDLAFVVFFVYSYKNLVDNSLCDFYLMFSDDFEMERSFYGLVYYYNLITWL